MAKVTVETVEPVHVRTGRALLNLSTRQFAEAVGTPLTIDKLKALEAGRATSADVRQAVLDAFEKFGVELQNGGRPGARVKDAAAWTAATGEKANP
tara:strand:+ start:1408 stop:1695 length:288 start_codon:yes stop_codon:yes gene_type:complete